MRFRTLVAAVLIGLAGLGVRVDATILVLAVSPSRIVIAADSRMTLRDTATGRIAGYSDSACKIWQEGTTVMALSGVVSSDRDAYDAGSLIPRMLTAPGTAREKFARTVGALRGQVRDNSAPSLPTELGLLVARFTQKVGPDAAAGMFRLDAIDASHDKPIACIGEVDCRNRYVALRPARAVDDSEESKRIRRGGLSEEETVRLLRDVIARQAALTPETVGGAIDIVVLDADGARWIARKRECR